MIRYREDHSTLQKCHKILQLFESVDSSNGAVAYFPAPLRNISNYSNISTSPFVQQSPSNLQCNPNSSTFSTPKHYLLQATKPKKNINNSSTHLSVTNKSRLQQSKYFRKQSIFEPKSNKKNNSKSRSQCRSSASKRSLTSAVKCHDSFVSAYCNQTRLDRIMQLKVKPQNRNHQRSYSTITSSRSSTGKQNKQSRLDRIMNIKVSKPKVPSHLSGYIPLKVPKKVSIPQQSLKNSQELKEIKRMQKAIQAQQQRQDRQWRGFERQRELKLKKQNQTKQKSRLDQRRAETKFQAMVAKELAKIQKKKQSK